MSILRATSAGRLQDAAWPCQPRAGLAIRSIIECKVHLSIWLCLPRLVGTHGLQSPSDLQDNVGGKSEMSFLPNRDLVFVVDDDASMLKSVARLLRQLGYGSLLFPSAEAFANHGDFGRGFASFSTLTWAMFQASSCGIVSKQRTFPCRSST